MISVHSSAACGLPEIKPIRCTVACPGISLYIYKGFQQNRLVAIPLLKVDQYLLCCQRQYMARQMFNFHPRKNEEPRVVNDQMQALAAVFFAPTNPIITLRQRPGRRREQYATKPLFRIVPRPDEISLMRSKRSFISKVVITLNEAILLFIRINCRELL